MAELKKLGFTEKKITDEVSMFTKNKQLKILRGNVVEFETGGRDAVKKVYEYSKNKLKAFDINYLSKGEFKRKTVVVDTMSNVFVLGFGISVAEDSSYWAALKGSELMFFNKMTGKKFSVNMRVQMQKASRYNLERLFRDNAEIEQVSNNVLLGDVIFIDTENNIAVFLEAVLKCGRFRIAGYDAAKDVNRVKHILDAKTGKLYVVTRRYEEVIMMPHKWYEPDIDETEEERLDALIPHPMFTLTGVCGNREITVIVDTREETCEQVRRKPYGNA